MVIDGFFNSTNNEGQNTFLKVAEISSLVYNYDQDIVYGSMNNGETFGFKGSTIRGEYGRKNIYKDMDINTGTMMFRLISSDKPESI